MKYTFLPNTDIKVSKICLGTMNFGNQNTIEESEEQMNAFLKENTHINKRFKLNQKLIDFNKIPKKIQNPIIKKFKLI